MSRVVVIAAAAIVGFGLGWFDVVLGPDIADAIGITNVSHYPPIIVWVSEVITAVAGAVVAWTWPDR